ERDLSELAPRLVQAGRDPGVPVGDGATLGFLDGSLGRDRLVGRGSGFQTRRGKASFSEAELARIAREEPGRLSGNVLLRPALESALLPTVAYVAGPGELRYLALAEPVYRQLGIPRQLPVPRWSGLLLEPRVARVLSKFSASLSELTADGGALERRLARLALPEGTEAALGTLRSRIEEGYRPVVEQVAAVDPTLERPAAAARARALFEVERLEKKLLQHARRRESVELGQVARARLSVRPEGKPQERVLSMAGFLARYGDGVLEAYAEHIAAWYRAALEAAPPTP
ncbi:MAG TPA: bacillithiol biosynthesis BshC, partial [Gemmatimonadales bacterium]|nr:bacillithiol biosynthesis BshC [Gemmatimonadales bacterium]